MNTWAEYLKQQVELYDAKLDIADACTPPSSWYVHEAFSRLENDSVFSRNWIMVAREDQVRERGQYLATEVCGEPIIVVRDDKLRAFYNVCRHHGAEIMQGHGKARALHCPYHGWTYNLDGSLRSTPQFNLARNFDPSCNGLIPVRVAVLEKFVFVCLSHEAPDLNDFVGALRTDFSRLQLDSLKFYRRVEYELDCNWKVFVDNYLDGGYHVPILHKDLNTALDYRQYKVEIFDRHCLQTCPMSNGDGDEKGVRRGSHAHYFWLYPNVMFNFYDGILDTNLTVPVSKNRCKVIFDYYFADSYDEDFRTRSIELANLVQEEDEMICLSVQKGLNSRSYDTGRLSPEREAGEHLFHKLLYKDFNDRLAQWD